MPKRIGEKTIMRGPNRWGAEPQKKKAIKTPLPAAAARMQSTKAGEGKASKPKPRANKKQRQKHSKAGVL